MRGVTALMQQANLILLLLCERKEIDQLNHSRIKRRCFCSLAGIQSAGRPGHLLPIKESSGENSTHPAGYDRPNMDKCFGDFQTGLITGATLSPGGVVFSTRAVIMQSKRKRSDRRSRPVYVPSENTLDAARKQLPLFEPYDT